MIDSDSTFGLPAASVFALRAVLARHAQVRKADIYGSRAKGNFRPGSDIDLTLFGDSLSARELLAIEVAIDALDLPYKVDLSLFDQIEDPALRSHIERIGKPFYRQASAR